MRLNDLSEGMTGRVKVTERQGTCRSGTVGGSRGRKKVRWKGDAADSDSSSWREVLSLCRERGQHSHCLRGRCLLRTLCGGENGGRRCRRRREGDVRWQLKQSVDLLAMRVAHDVVLLV